MATENHLLGLLATPIPRNCQRGHGPMERMPGSWALQQVERMPDNRLRLPGFFFVTTVHRCAKCGAVELVDDEVAHGGA